MTDATVKLYYGNSKGRAEIIRLVLAAAEKKYEDVRFEKGEWAKHKPDAPFGQMPYMDIDGKLYGQSIALATYFAREFGLYGKSNLEMLQIDQVVHLIQDLFSLAVKTLHEKDEEKKMELKKTFRETECVRILGYLEKLLKENKSDYFVGDELSLADIALYDVITGCLACAEDYLPSLDDFPMIQKLTETVGNNPNIKAYVSERPITAC